LGSNDWTVFAREGADDLQVDGGNVYWSSRSRSMIAKAPISGGPPTVVVTGTAPEAFALDATSVIVRDDIRITRVTPK
jgi:hypothetical protein